MEIINNTAKFKVEIIGDKTASTYLGEFKSKCILSIGDELNADKHYRNMLGDNMLYATQEIKELAFALSQLKVRITESPYFWGEVEEGFNCEDKNLVFELLNLCIEAQGLYLEEKQIEINKKKEKLTNMLKSGEVEEDAPDIDDIQDGV